MAGYSGLFDGLTTEFFVNYEPTRPQYFLDFLIAFFAQPPRKNLTGEFSEMFVDADAIDTRKLLIEICVPPIRVEYCHSDGGYRHEGVE